MAKTIDLTGKRFGIWTVHSKSISTYQPLWLCVCDCGTERLVSGANLRNGATTSCGCDRKHVVKHGHARRNAKNPTYSIWKGMIDRCRPDFRDRHNYADRGISVCEKWLDYPAFLADMGERPGGLTLDRIDNDKGYEPGNCRWATMKVQRLNQRRVTWVEYQGETMNAKDAAARIGVTRAAIQNEMDRHSIGAQEAFDRVRSRKLG